MYVILYYDLFFKYKTLRCIFTQKKKKYEHEHVLDIRFFFKFNTYPEFFDIIKHECNADYTLHDVKITKTKNIESINI
jgi:hypothetical protein